MVYMMSKIEIIFCAVLAILASSVMRGPLLAQEQKHHITNTGPSTFIVSLPSSEKNPYRYCLFGKTSIPYGTYVANVTDKDFNLHRTSRILWTDSASIENLPNLNIQNDLVGDIFRYDNKDMTITPLDDFPTAITFDYNNVVNIPVEYHMTGIMGANFRETFNLRLDYTNYTHLVSIWNPAGLESAKTTTFGVANLFLLAICAEAHEDQENSN